MIFFHHSNFIMSAMASQITGVSIVCSTVYSGGHLRKHQSSASLAFVTWIHQWPVESPHKGPITQIFFIRWRHNVHRWIGRTDIRWFRLEQSGKRVLHMPLFYFPTRFLLAESMQTRLYTYSAKLMHGSFWPTWRHYFGKSNMLLCLQLHIDGWVQDCSTSIANALELLQSCTKPSLLSSVTSYRLLLTLSAFRYYVIRIQSCRLTHLIIVPVATLRS